MKKITLLTVLSSFLLLAACRSVNSIDSVSNSGNGNTSPSNPPSVTSQNGNTNTSSSNDSYIPSDSSLTSEEANPSEEPTSTTSRPESDDSSVGGRGFFHSEYGVGTTILFYLDDECLMTGDTTTGGRYEYQGKYSQNGNNITMRFTKCYYDSLLSPGKSLSYTATLSGNQLFLDGEARTITLEEYFW